MRVRSALPGVSRRMRPARPIGFGRDDRAKSSPRIASPGNRPVSFASDQVARLFRARAGVATVFFLNGFGWGSWVPRIAEIQTKLGASDGQLGLALFMAAVGALIAMPLAGAAAHRYGSRTATAVTVACYGLSLPLLALAPDLIGLGLALLARRRGLRRAGRVDERAGRGGGEALLAPDHVVAARHVQPRRHGRGRRRPA